MIPFRPRRPAATILGLAFDGDRLEGVELRRTNGSVVPRKTFAVTLSLDPLTNDPQLVGREIRKHLDAAGVRERRCAVCLPTHWILSLQVPLPALPEPDLSSFLQLEIERGFPYGPEALVVARSGFSVASGESFATLIAIPRDHVSRLEAALAAAQLKPLTFSLGPIVLQPSEAPDSPGVLTLIPGARGIALLITQGTGVALLRTIESAYESVGGTPELQTDSFLRELRITLGQLPASLKESLQMIRLVGQGELVDQLFDQLQGPAEAWKMRVERLHEYPRTAFGVSLPPGTQVSAAFGAAVRQLTGAGDRLEFLPPKRSAWNQFLTRYSSRKLAWTGIAAGALAAAVAAAFLVQQIQLWRWGAKWQAMAARADSLEQIQTQIRRYRPWFDESYRSLNILRRLTEAFPEEGSVSAKTVEIRPPATVICSGSARDQQALLQTLARLGTAKEVANIKVEQARGTSPIEFTFNFQWAERSGM